MTGLLVAGHLAGVRSSVVVVCTVGDKIDEFSSQVMEDDIVLGFAVDGVGSAAVEGLANAVCRKIDLDAAKKEFQTTIPLSPGMIGWVVEEGQPEIFSLVDPTKIGGNLTPNFMMIPQKSLSMIVGLGPGISSVKRICDNCTMR